MDKERGGVMKRYNLVLPEAQFEALQQLADEQGSTVVAILRRFIKLGLLVDKALDSGAQLVKKEDGKETIIELLW